MPKQANKPIGSQLLILTALSVREDAPVKASEICHSFDLARSTCYEALHNLMRHGYVEAFEKADGGLKRHSEFAITDAGRALLEARRAAE